MCWICGVLDRETHFFAIPLLSTPAETFRIDDAGSRSTAAFIVHLDSILVTGSGRVSPQTPEFQKYTVARIHPCQCAGYTGQEGQPSPSRQGIPNRHEGRCARYQGSVGLSHVEPSQGIWSTETLTQIFSRANAGINPGQLLASPGLLVRLNFSSAQGAATIEKYGGLASTAVNLRIHGLGGAWASG